LQWHNLILSPTFLRPKAAIEKHVLKWALVNEAGLVFVLIYNKAVFSNITYVDELLTKFKEVR
jgi:hypothetical protein